jgi:hypothetical protein
VTPYEIPLSAEPQQFKIQLAGNDCRVRFYWCRAAACWMLDIADVDEVDIVTGIPVVTGCDLLQQYKHLELGGSIVVQTDYDPDAVPTFDNLGETGRVYFVVE